MSARVVALDDEDVWRAKPRDLEGLGDGADLDPDLGARADVGAEAGGPGLERGGGGGGEEPDCGGGVGESWRGEGGDGVGFAGVADDEEADAEGGGVCGVLGGWGGVLGGGEEGEGCGDAGADGFDGGVSADDAFAEETETAGGGDCVDKGGAGDEAHGSGAEEGGFGPGVLLLEGVWGFCRGARSGGFRCHDSDGVVNRLVSCKIGSG